MRGGWSSAGSQLHSGAAGMPGRLLARSRITLQNGRGKSSVSAHDVSRAGRQGCPEGHAQARRMRPPEGFAMERMLRGMGFYRHAGMSLLLALVVCGTALGQGIQVSGTVNSAKGVGLRGVTVHLRGTETRTVTDADGKYSLTAPSDGVLTHALIGYRGTAQTIGGRTSVNVIMDEAIPVLPEVVVTGYTSQRRPDITGAVSTPNMEALQRQTSASVLQRLGGAVPG